LMYSFNFGSGPFILPGCQWLQTCITAVWCIPSTWLRPIHFTWLSM